MAERLKAAVLKTVGRASVSGVRIPLPPPTVSSSVEIAPCHSRAVPRARRVGEHG